MLWKQKGWFLLLSAHSSLIGKAIKGFGAFFKKSLFFKYMDLDKQLYYNEVKVVKRKHTHEKGWDRKVKD